MRSPSVITCILFSALLCICKASEQIVTIPSKLMSRKFKASVVVPDSYDSSLKSYSVIYLLHGYGRDHKSWGTLVPLDKLSNKYQVIFVCPSGNRNSWYVDSPVKKNFLFATYITREVVHFIDSTWRTHATDKGRAVIGSSMGGHGALTITAQNPDLFIGAGSISGIVDLNDFPNEWEIDRVLGPWQTSKENWDSFSFIGMIDSLVKKERALVIECGTDDPVLAGNRKAHEKMLSLEIEHDYYERPGNHTQKYVKKVFEYHLLYFSRRLLEPR
ncbi:MAG: esterase family protein [Chitinivibrionales bacterium]|nr:esterase family protein [Chitinivibrionales bacterium]